MGVGSRAVRDLAAQHAQHARDGSCLVAVGRGGPKLLEQPPIPGSLVGAGEWGGRVRRRWASIHRESTAGACGLGNDVGAVPVAWDMMWERKS